MRNEKQSSDNGVSTSASWRVRVQWLLQQTKNRGLWLSLGLGFSLFFLWLAFRDIAISNIIVTLSQVELWYAALALGLVLVSQLARAARWKLLYHDDQRNPDFFRLTEVLFISQMLNIVSPVRLGELTRIYFMGTLEARSRAQTLGTIAVEKWLDILTLLVLMLLVPVSVSLPAWFQDSKQNLLALFITFLGTILILYFGKEKLLILLDSTSRFLPENWRGRVRQAVSHTLISLEIFQSPWVGLRLQGWSLAIWSLGALANYVVFLSLGISLPFSAALFLLVVLQVGVVVPSAPGVLGVFNYLCVLALGVFGVGKSIALSYSVILYLVGFGPILLLGAAFLWWESAHQINKSTV